MEESILVGVDGVNTIGVGSTENGAEAFAMSLGDSLVAGEIVRLKVVELKRARGKTDGGSEIERTRQ